MIGRRSRLKLTRSGSAAARALAARKQPAATHRTCRIEQPIRESFPDVATPSWLRNDTTSNEDSRTDRSSSPGGLRGPPAELTPCERNRRGRGVKFRSRRSFAGVLSQPILDNSPGGASRLAALLVAYILPVCALLAP